MLVTSIFSFSHNVFKSCLPQVRKKSGLCRTQLTTMTKMCFESNLDKLMGESNTIVSAYTNCIGTYKGIALIHRNE